MGPFGPALGKVDRCPSEPGPGGPGLGWDGEPGGECGKGNGAPVGDQGVSCARDSFAIRGWASSLGEKGDGVSAGGKPEARTVVFPASGL